MFFSPDLMFRINNIDNKWINYENELGLKVGVFRPSFYYTFHHINREKFPTLTNLGLKVHYNENEEWVKKNVRSIVLDYFLPFAEKLKDIQFCDKLINKDIEITDETCKLSPIDGLPFRKIFIAEEAGNPRLEEIKSAMRKYVNERYKTGIEKNYEKLIKIKPVFEKLFGV